MTHHEADQSVVMAFEWPSYEDFFFAIPKLFSYLNEPYLLYVIFFPAKSCEKLFTYGKRSNAFYRIHKPDIVPMPRNQSYIRVWCDMHGPNGGWILLQERANAAFNFYRDWVSYEYGFGKPGVGYWLGNLYIHSITFKTKYVLRFELPGYFNEQTVTLLAEYDNFQVLSPSNGYTLKLGKFRGGLGNLLSIVNNSQFSTWDRDNDAVQNEACARINKGAWWYGNNCNVNDMNTMLFFRRSQIKVKEVLEGKFLQILPLKGVKGHR